MWECACGFANDDSAMRCVACDARPPIAEATRGSLTFVNLRTHERIVVTRPGGLIGRAGDFKPGSFSPRVSRVHLVAEAHDNGPWTIEFVGRHKTEIDASGTWVAMEPDQPREVVGGEKLRMADMIFRLEVAPVGQQNETSPADTKNQAPSFGSRNQVYPVDTKNQENERSAFRQSDAVRESAEDRLESEVRESRLDDVDRESRSNGAADENGNADQTLGWTDIDPQSEIEEESDVGPVQIGWVVRCPVCGASYRVENEQARITSCASCFDPMDAGKIARCAPQPEYE